VKQLLKLRLDTGRTGEVHFFPFQELLKVSQMKGRKSMQKHYKSDYVDSGNDERTRRGPSTVQNVNEGIDSGLSKHLIADYQTPCN
jgi:hypothetical protein